MSIIFESAPDGYYINDYEGTFVAGNRAGEELLGYPREELIGKNFVEAGIFSMDGVLRWFTSKINNGILEGINSLIQAAKAKARGYRTKRNLITMLYLIAGKLNFDLPT